MSIGEPYLEMIPDPCATWVHHRDARRQAMIEVASTFDDPLGSPMIGIDDILEDPVFERGIEDMLNDIFCDVLPQENVGEEETK